MKFPICAWADVKRPRSIVQLLTLSLSLTFSNHVESCQIVLNQNMWIPFLTHWSWVAAHQRGWAWAPGSCAAAPARCCSWRQISKTLGIELWSPRQHQIRNGRVHGTIWHPMYHGENGLCLVTSCDPTLSWQSSQTTLSKSCASGYTAATLRNSTSLSNDMRLMPQRQVMQASQAFHSIPNIDKARTSESPYQEVYGPWFLWDIFKVLQASTKYQAWPKLQTFGRRNLWVLTVEARSPRPSVCTLWLCKSNVRPRLARMRVPHCMRMISTTRSIEAQDLELEN